MTSLTLFLSSFSFLSPAKAFWTLASDFSSARRRFAVFVFFNARSALAESEVAEVEGTCCLRLGESDEVSFLTGLDDVGVVEVSRRAVSA